MDTTWLTSEALDPGQTPATHPATQDPDTEMEHTVSTLSPTDGSSELVASDQFHFTKSSKVSSFKEVHPLTNQFH